MPIYCHRCITCEAEQEDFMSLSAPAPEHCGQPMAKVPQPAGMALLTRNGNWTGHSMPGKQWVGGGRPRPKTIGRGHGLGGKRKNPTMKKVLDSSGIRVRGGTLRTKRGT